MQNPLDYLGRLHRFFSSQLVYPIVLSTMLAFALFSARVIQSQELTYKNLVWNLFLAWLPFIFSLTAAALHALFPRHGWLLIFPGVMWLIFLPNAPYIITDFLHLVDRPSVPLWYDILLLATFAWTGCFLAIASLRTMQTLVKKYFGWFLSWVFAFSALALGGLGIYLGRFSGWNSWDLFFQPKEILYDVAIRLLNPFSNLRFFGFTILFTAFLVILYLTFMSVRPENEA